MRSVHPRCLIAAKLLGTGQDTVITSPLTKDVRTPGGRAVDYSEVSPLTISILGPLTVRRGDTDLTAGDLGGPKPRQILEILLLNFGTAVSKSRIMDLLWNDKHPAVALPTLESYVSVLRRGLQPGIGRTGPLRTVPSGYMIDRSLVDLDLDRFHTMTRQAQSASPHTRLDLLTDALTLASTPLLGDEVLPTWAEEQRTLHSEHVRLTRILAAETALHTGNTRQAIAWAEVAVREDPLDERAWKTLILALEDNGETTAALRTFERCRKTLDDELGCAPSAPLKEAHARLLITTAPTPGTTSGTGTGFRTILAPGADQWSPDLTDPTPVSEPEPEPETLGILIADDHTTFSDLLAGALDREPDFHSVGAARTVNGAVTMFRDLQPDVLVLDLYLADGSGLNAAETILTETPHARIVMLTGNPSQEALREAARMGICGFLPKDGALGIMLDTLRHARPGNMIVHPSLLTRLGNTIGPGAGPADQ